MPPSNTFIPTLEATLKAEYLAAGTAGRPMFGSAEESVLLPGARERQERTLSELSKAGLDAWDVLGAHQVTKYTGVSAGWLSRMRGAGEGPPGIPTGDGVIMYAAGEVFYWVECGRAEAKEAGR